ncbi:hypothetical protein SAMN04487954_12613 [Billgrantia gudaonensis]|uniref:Uncharacterized protein n=1 Tax=Billgrantia gudaonensis TaxID=376427 RepID=A0A1G9EBK2_9GAMM|nr:hypothetical protein SAMN04487954_12613 [Halomonas gudaonensis]
MGVIANLKLGRTLTKLTTLFVEVNRSSNLNREEVRYTRSYQDLTDKLKPYNPDKVSLELTNNMMVTAKLGHHERLKAQENLLDALSQDGFAAKGM